MNEHVIGIDGCRGGWLVCRLRIADRAIDLLAVAESFSYILEREKPRRTLESTFRSGFRTLVRRVSATCKLESF